MSIKVNRVYVYKGTHQNVVAEYFQVIGFEQKALGQPPVVITIQEAPTLHQALQEVRNQGVRWTPRERKRTFDIFIPFYERK